MAFAQDFGCSANIMDGQDEAEYARIEKDVDTGST